MFDVSFSELVILGVVSLIVIGPERLPRVARTVGHLLGRMQRYVNEVKADISREIELEELRKLKTDMQEAATNFETSVKKELDDTEHALNQSIAPLAEELESPLAESAAEAAPPQPTSAESAPAAIPAPAKEPADPPHA